MHITISPVGRGRYHARLSPNGRLLCTSRTPFLIAARELMLDGRATPDTILSMSHEGSDTVAMRGRAGDAARLTIEEGRTGRPRFVPYRARPSTPAGDDEAPQAVRARTAS